MSSPFLATPGWPLSVPEHASEPSSKLPARYLGVWARTLLETPTSGDTSTFVRWLQLGHWHADIRIPLTNELPTEGFSGLTQVRLSGGRDICRWQRVVDYRPMAGPPDEGWIDFVSPDRLIETGVHSTYREVWERLPGSTGRRIALAEPARMDGQASARLFLAGDYLMRVRPAQTPSSVFEISFGKLVGETFCIEASTIPALRARKMALAISRLNDALAEVVIDAQRSAWAVLEWEITPSHSD